VRLYFALFLLCSLGVRSAGAAPPRALPVDPSELTNTAPAQTAPSQATPAQAGPAQAVQAQAPLPLAVPGGVNIHWYGHGFIYITSSVGVRAAIDPFGPNTVHYFFPPHLTADFVLVSHEAEDHGATEGIFGNPLIFRSVTAVGLNRANGTSFHGVSLQRDPDGKGGANTAFSLMFDGITMGYLGQISAPLVAQEKEELGHIDVLFLPVGLTTLTVAQLNQVVADVGAKVIIPINYKTERSGNLPLRELDEYLADTHFPVRHFDTDEVVLTRDTLPAEPTLYLLKSP
jgi:L-ascorbate metabolism protein UlaG (beta-lactamase superfamily)